MRRKEGILRKIYFKEVIRLRQEEGLSYSAISRLLPLSRRTITRWNRIFEAENELSTTEPSIMKKEEKRAKESVDSQESKVSSDVTKTLCKTTGKVTVEGMNMEETLTTETEQELQISKLKKEIEKLKASISRLREENKKRVETEKGLVKRLHDSELKGVAYSRLIEKAKEYYNIDLKKNFGRK